MTIEFKEIPINVSDATFEQDLRGRVVNLDSSRRDRLWITGCSVALLAIAAGSWAFVASTRTKEDVLEEQLKSASFLQELYGNSTTQLQKTALSAEQLKAVFTDLFHVASSPLRQGASMASPYLAVRPLAMLSALEALLRLELEYPSEENLAFVDKSQQALGCLQLEYHDHGALQRVPLSELASLRSERKPSEEDIARVLKTESETLVSCAFTLGRWFRFYGDEDRAERSFDLARRYVDGYRMGHDYVMGRKPSSLGPLWSEYSQCVESLAQMAYQKQNFREARSLLARLFTAPQELSLNETPLDRSMQTTRQRLIDLHYDIGVFENALANPSQVPSFPLFHETDQTIAWGDFIDALRVMMDEHGQTVGSVLAGTLPASIVDSLRKEPGIKWLAQEKKESILRALNQLTDDPDLAKKINLVQLPKLSRLSQQYMQQVQDKGTVSLSRAERQFLNRDIIDVSFAGSISNPFILSDGSRLSNALTPDKVALYISLCQEELDSCQNPSRTAELKRMIEAAKGAQTGRGQSPPIFSDLLSLLESKKLLLTSRVDAAEGTYADQYKAAQAARADTGRAGQEGKLDAASLQELVKADQLARSRMAQAKLDGSVAADELAKVEEAISQLYSPLQSQLANLRGQLVQFEDKEGRIKEQTFKQEGPILASLDVQIDLRQHFIDLLKNLKATQGDARIQKLELEHALKRKELLQIAQQMKTTGASGREELLRRQATLEEEQKALVTELTDLLKPLLDITEKIAAEEQLVWSAQDKKKECEEKIAALIGSGPASLQALTQARQDLLMLRADDVLHDTELANRIADLTAQIDGAYAQLGVLLQTEATAQSTISTFYPQEIDNTYRLPKDRLLGLVETLRKQQEVAKSFSLLWTKRDMQRQMFVQQNLIQDNISAICTAVGNKATFTERETNDLSRYMKELIEARRQLLALSRSLMRFEQDPEHFAASRSFNTGFELDIMELYRQEEELGLSLTAYSKAFEAHQDAVLRYADLSEQKRKVDAALSAAAATRDQVQMDMLSPTQVSLESQVREVAGDIAKLDSQLQAFRMGFTNRSESVAAFRSKLAQQGQVEAEGLVKLSMALSENDAQLLSLAQDAFSEANPIQKQLSKLEVADLAQIDQLLTSNQVFLDRLKRARDLKIQQNYYKIKALWLIGQSFVAQSQLRDFSALQTSGQLKFELLESASKNGYNTVNEFDPRRTYSDDFLGEEAEAQDKNQASFAVWVDSLERAAIHIFEEEIPKYSFSQSIQTISPNILDNFKKQDYEVYVARSRFCAAEVYLKRVLRLIHTSPLKVGENRAAQNEIRNAIVAFNDFIHVSEGLALGEGLDGTGFADSVYASEEFPERSKQSVNLVSEARFHLATAYLWSDQVEQAIEQYRLIYKGLALRMKENPDVASIDPILLDQTRYQTQISPIMASILARYDAGHELLYRLGVAYARLAEEKAGQSPALSSMALSYFSQLILTQSYSPFRQAALFKRAQIFADLGHLDAARDDLVGALPDPIDPVLSLANADMDIRGDLPGELRPGYALVAFELGKLYYQNQDWALAAESFLKASKSPQDASYIVHAKLRYIDSLMQKGDCLSAHAFAKDLVEAKDHIDAADAFYFYPDVCLKFAEIKRALGDLAGAEDWYKQVLLTAPKSLLVKGELDLSNTAAFASLIGDYRDEVRPLALASFGLGELAALTRKTESAKRYFSDAQNLFSSMTQKEDRVYRQQAPAVFAQFKALADLKTRWALLKADSDRELFDLFAAYRSEMQEPDGLDDQRLQQQLEAYLDTVQKSLPAHAATLAKLSDFYDAEQAKLPETLASKNQRALFDASKRPPTAMMQRYLALGNMEKYLSTHKGLAPKILLENLATVFGMETLEAKLVDSFLLQWASDLALTQEDRSKMQASASNTDNILKIVDADKRLASCENSLRDWLLKESLATGLDARQIRPSEQGALLEEVLAYKAATLALDDRSASYEKLAKLATDYLNAYEAPFTWVQNKEALFSVLEQATLAAQSQEDWVRCERFATAMCKETLESNFLSTVWQDKLRVQYALTEALGFNIAQKTEDLASVEDSLLKKEKMQELANLQGTRQRLLTELASNTGDDAISCLVRISAKAKLEDT